jgi:hypothetical protein
MHGLASLPNSFRAQRTLGGKSWRESKGLRARLEMIPISNTWRHTKCALSPNYNGNNLSVRTRRGFNEREMK